MLLVAGAWLAAWWSSAPAGSASETAAWREIVTERGERARIQLVDGTQVTLNVDSRLRLPGTFGPHARRVYLEGEAHFDVASDSSRPFTVHTARAAVEVRGTVFGVRSYPEQQQVEVAVAEGAVALRAEEDARARAELGAGQLGRLAENGAQVTTQDVDVGAYLGWTEGRLVFENAVLSEVATRLARWYDLDVKLEDPALASRRLTATLNSTSAHDVLDVVAATLGLRYRIEGNTVFLMDR